MPWEKNFEESDVIEKAMHVFWEKGYATTSITDNTAAPESVGMALKRCPSLPPFAG